MKAAFLVSRINRALLPRQERIERTGKANRVLGEFVRLDTRRGDIIATDVDLARLARRLGIKAI